MKDSMDEPAINCLVCGGRGSYPIGIAETPCSRCHGAKIDPSPHLTRLVLESEMLDLPNLTQAAVEPPR